MPVDQKNDQYSKDVGWGRRHQVNVKNSTHLSKL